MMCGLIAAQQAPTAPSAAPVHIPQTSLDGPKLRSSYQSTHIIPVSDWIVSLVHPFKMITTLSLFLLGV